MYQFKPKGRRFYNSGRPLVARDMLRASKSFNFTNITASGGGVTQTVAVIGARVGDDVTVHADTTPTAGVVYQAWVSASDVVSVRAVNVSAADIDPPAITLRVIVWKAS